MTVRRGLVIHRRGEETTGEKNRLSPTKNQQPVLPNSVQDLKGTRAFLE